MIKKHIITCTVIIALLVMAKVFAYDVSETAKSLTKNTNTTTTPIIKSVKPAAPKAPLNFAAETLPKGDVKVANKMSKILASFSYSSTQTNRLHRKALEWFPVIEPILKAHGIPEDFKYVPLVESGLRAGVSPKGATGMWQFMPGTARMYGLKVNSKVDERNNLRKSTIAACKYLNELHKIFGNWTLVAAAYNVGDGNIRRQMSRQNKDNYFKLKLNRETGGYVYKLISMKEIIVNPARNGYTAPRELLAMNAD